MAYPLKKNLTGKPNVVLTSLDDTKLDDNFAKSLEILITNWVQSGVYNITLMNAIDGNSFAVIYSTYTVTTNPTPADLNLAEYIKNNVNPSLADGQLNIDTSNKKITYSKKEKSTTTKGDSLSTSGTSGTSISSAFSSASGHTMSDIDKAVEDRVYKDLRGQVAQDYEIAKSLSGTTTTTTTKKVQTESKIKNEILREEIMRIKKLINYGI